MREKIEERTFFPWSVKEPLFIETNGRCAHCGTDLDRYTNLTVDHVIPLNKGGTNDPENLTVLCETCNEEKSDMILSPRIWYPYLPESRKKKLVALMRDYMRKTDYLAEDCLVPLDSFRIEVPITTQKKNPNGSYKVIRMPAYIQGIRMKRDDAFAWLMEYRKFLQYRDAVGTHQHPSDFQAPCYLLKKGNLDVAMVNPWMIHEYDENYKNYRNEVFLDWFFAPGLPKRDYLPEMLSCMVRGFESYVFGCLAGSMEEGACAVLTHIRCFVSDHYCDPVFDILAKGHTDEIRTFGKNERLPSRIRELSAFNLIGDKKSCKVLRQQMDETSADGCMSMDDAVKLCGTLNKRFKDDRKER